MTMKKFSEYLSEIEEPSTMTEFNSIQLLELADYISAALAESITEKDLSEIEDFLEPFVSQNRTPGMRYLVGLTFVELARAPLISTSTRKFKYIGKKNGYLVFEDGGKKRGWPAVNDLKSVVQYYLLMSSTTEIEHLLSLVTLKWNKPMVKKIKFNQGLVV